MHSNGTHLNRARRLPSKYPLHASYTGSTSASHLNWNTKTSIELSSLRNACYPWTCYARDFHRVSCSRITRAPFNIFIFQVTCLYGASISMEDWTEIVFRGPCDETLVPWNSRNKRALAAFSAQFWNLLGEGRILFFRFCFGAVIDGDLNTFWKIRRVNFTRSREKCSKWSTACDTLYLNFV